MTTFSPGKSRRGLSAGVACAAFILALAACTNSDFSLSEKDAFGTWRAGSDLPAKLELAEDGTFRATAWPIEVGCSGTPPKTATELRKSVTVDFSGTWDESDEGAMNLITLVPESEMCRTSWIFANFRSEDGVLYTCTELDVHVDLATAQNWFILYQGEPETTPDSSRCFNYN